MSIIFYQNSASSRLKTQVYIAKARKNNQTIESNWQKKISSTDSSTSEKHPGEGGEDYHQEGRMEGKVDHTDTKKVHRKVSSTTVNHFEANTDY